MLAHEKPQTGLAGHSGNHRPNGAQWADCPGCDRCRPHGGYVLRRGSWRPTSSWEPVLLLAKQGGYFCDGESVKTAAAAATVNDRRIGTERSRDFEEAKAAFGDQGQRFRTLAGNAFGDAAGANLRDVWTIPAEPGSSGICSAAACRWFTPDGNGCVIHPDKKKYCPRCDAPMVFHYAAFPTELVYRCLAAGTSQRGYCPACGRPWARVVETTPLREIAVGMDGDRPKLRGRQDQGLASQRTGLSPSNNHKDMPQCPINTTLGWRPTCACLPHEPRPGVVLDPFAGSGRVGVQCQRMGLDFVGVELSPAYADMARRLLAGEMPLFADPG